MNSRQREDELIVRAIHEENMKKGCQWCGAAAVGVVCPDCYTCRACGIGCLECAEVRRR